MALTPEEIDALPNYTAGQMVKLLRHCVAELASNPESQVVGPNNHGYTMRDMDQLKRMLQFWEEREAQESAAAGGPFEYADLR